MGDILRSEVKNQRTLRGLKEFNVDLDDLALQSFYIALKRTIELDNFSFT